MKLAGILALLLGLLAGTLLIAHYGVAAVTEALLTIGWTGFLVIILLHLAILFLCGIAWFVLVPPAERSGPWPFVWGRLVREAGSEILPLSQLGGLVMGGRAASLAGLSGKLTAASSVVDATMELLGQLAFAALGLAILIVLHPEAPFITATALALVGALVVVVLFIGVQRRGFVLLERIADRLSRQWSETGIWAPGAIQDSIRRTYQRHGRLLAGFLLHLLAWIAGAFEAWVALRFMGSPLPPAAVIAIEGLLAAARGIAFAVPAALGIQEGAYVVLGGLFGLPPDTALALSLLKRARGLALGVPPLLLWQIAEGRQLLRRRKAAAKPGTS
ncbi:MAG TPA: lysylphosphatidylglycerol synthase domain-containing protein [Dongiaceae bacterium]|jgi:putative membrane protein